MIIKMSFGVSSFLGSRLMTAFTLTKRDNRSPSMARSADSAIEAKMHGRRGVKQRLCRRWDVVFVAVD